MAWQKVPAPIPNNNEKFKPTIRKKLQKIIVWKGRNPVLLLRVSIS